MQVFVVAAMIFIARIANAVQRVTYALPLLTFNPVHHNDELNNEIIIFQIVLSSQDKPEYYDLFARYIHARHKDGSMFRNAESV